MSRHPSFGRVGIKKVRNVLKRHERIDILRARKKYKEGDTVYGLPKTRVEQ